jgi:hypothetical protein
MNADKEPRRQMIAIGVAVAAGILAVILRIVPHPTSFSSVGACGLFGGARVRSWHAYALPLAVMFVSDLILWTLSRFDPNYSLVHISRVYVYASFMVYVFIGRWLRDKNSIATTTIAATLGALQFFLVTNFCTWLFQPWTVVPEAFMYSRDLNGLATCFLAALPFYGQESTATAHPFVLLMDQRLNIVWTALGDIFFTTVYLLVYAKLAERAVEPKATAVPAANA